MKRIPTVGKGGIGLDLLLITIGTSLLSLRPAA